MTRLSASIWCTPWWYWLTIVPMQRVGKLFIAAPFATVIGATALVLLCLYQSSARADGRADIFGFEEDDLPVVLSASRLRQPLNQSPASITVLDRSVIEQSGARSVVDLLLLVPGFQVGRLSNGIPVATYRGQSERYNPRMQLLIDGRPTYVPLYGGIPWGELPLTVSEIERIEVIRGPNSATFGPNSLYAVVSITTRAPASDAGWILDLEGGGNEFLSPTLNYYGKAGSSDFRINLKTEQDQGFSNIEDRERAKQGSLHIHRSLSSTDTMTFALGGIRGGHTERATALEPDDLISYLTVTNHYTQWVWERATSTDDALRLQYYFNYFKHDDRLSRQFDLGEATGNPAAVGIPFTVDIDRRAKSSRHEIELQKSQRLNDRHRLVFGGALRRDTVQGRFIFSDEIERQVLSQRAFVHSEYQWRPQLLLNSGVLIDHSSLSGTSISPRLSLIQELNNNQHLRYSYSRSVRSPLLLEEDGQIEFDYVLPDGTTITDVSVYNQEILDPEFLDVFDLGYFYASTDRDLTFDAKLSYQKISDQIRTSLNTDYDEDLANGVGRFYENRESYSIKSVEFELDFKPVQSTHFRLGYSRAFDLRARSYEQDLTPEHTLSLFASKRFPRALTLSGEYYYTSDWIWDDVRDRSRVNRLDLRLEKGVRVGRIDARFSVQGEWRLGRNVDYLERNKVEDLYFAKISVRF